MDKKDFSNLKTSLQELDAKQLKEVKTIVESRITSFGPENEQQSLQFYQMLIHEAQKDGKRLPPFSVMVRQVNKTTFCNNFEIVDEYIKNFFNPKNQSEFKQACQICSEMIISEIKKKNVAFSPKNVVWLMPYIGEIIDRSFPGYATSGMLSVLLNRRK